MNCIWVLSVFQFNQNLFVCRSFIMFSENSMLFSCGRVWIEANSRDLDQGTPRVCIPSYLGRCQCQGGWWERLGHCLRSCPWRLEWVWFIFEIALGRKMTQVNPINTCFLDLFGWEDILHAALLAPTSTWYHGIHGWWIFPGDQVEGVAIQALKLPCRPLKRLRQPAVVNARFGPFVQIRSCWRPMLRVWDVVLWEMYLEIEGTFFFAGIVIVDLTEIVVFVWGLNGQNWLWGINSYEVFVEEFCLGPEVPMQYEQCEHHGGGHSVKVESTIAMVYCLTALFSMIYTKQHLPPHHIRPVTGGEIGWTQVGRRVPRMAFSVERQEVFEK